MSKRTIFPAIAILLLSALSACKSQYEALLESNDAEAKYNAAFDYFNEGKYSKASQLFESLAAISNGTSQYEIAGKFYGSSNGQPNDTLNDSLNEQLIILYGRQQRLLFIRHIRTT